MAELGSGSTPRSDYPGALDTNNSTEVDSPNVGKTVITAAKVDDGFAAIINIQTELGTDPAGTLTDVKTYLQTDHKTNGTHKAGIVLEYPALQSYTTAGLSAAGTAGRLALVTDGGTPQNLVEDNASNWRSIYSRNTSVIVVTDPQFGAKGDNATDDTTALQTAFTLGGHIYLPAGTYLINGSLKWASNSYIHGAGRGKTIIKLKNGSNPASSIGLLQHSGTGGIPAAGYYDQHVTIAHLSIDGNKANNIGTVDGVLMSGVQDGSVIDVEAYNCSEVGIVLSSTFSSDSLFHAANTAIGCYAYDNTADGFQGAVGQFTGCFGYRNGSNGFRIVTSKSTVLEQPYVTLIGCVAYKNTSNGFYTENQSGIARMPIAFSGCAAHLNTNSGFAFATEQASMTNCLSTHNTADGVKLAADKCLVSNSIIKNNGAAGVLFFGDRNYCSILQNIITDDQTSKTQTYAISEIGLSSPGVGNLIEGNQVAGNLTGTILAALVGRSATYRIFNNPGYNPVGISTISVGGSPFTYTAGTSPETVYIYAGTISDISTGSGTIATASPAQIHLSPNQAVVVTYTGLPTMKKYVH